MNDFDYIADGGFIIECKDGHTVGLTKEQGDIIKKECEFLRNCFRHGTIESNGILKKPDWSVAIARHLVEVLTKGQTTVSNLELYEELIHAGDYACIDLRLCSFVNYIDITDKEGTQQFSTLVDASKYRFQFRAKVTSAQWLQLLNMGILLYRKETNFVVKVGKEQAMDRSQTMARRKLDTKTSEFLVHADRSIRALLKMSSIIGDSRRRDRQVNERFCIYFESKESMPEEHHELIDRLAGGEAYIRTCADADVSSEGYTVSGSFDVLRRALRPLQVTPLAEDDAPLYCSLRIDDPSPDTLGRFINACQAAKDFPGTLGLDASSNRYFCKKSVRDMRIILDYLADFSTKAEVTGDFKVYELSSEDDAF